MPRKTKLTPAEKTKLLRRLKGAKRKGDKYELEVAKYLNDMLHGGRNVAWRTPLSGGGASSAFGHGGWADLTGVPGIWAECKRTERLKLDDAIRQATRSIRGKNSPDRMAIISRKSNVDISDSLVIMRLHEWLDLYRAFLHSIGIKTELPAASPNTIPATPEVHDPHAIASDDTAQLDMVDWLNTTIDKEAT
jgi:hypothetical protein